MSYHPIRHGDSGVSSARKQSPLGKVAVSEATPLPLYGRQRSLTGKKRKCKCGKTIAESNKTDVCYCCGKRNAQLALSRISQTVVSDENSLRAGNPFYGKPDSERVRIPINRHRV